MKTFITVLTSTETTIISGQFDNLTTVDWTLDWNHPKAFLFAAELTSFETLYNYVNTVILLYMVKCFSNNRLDHADLCRRFSLKLSALSYWNWNTKFHILPQKNIFISRYTERAGNPGLIWDPFNFNFNGDYKARAWETHRLVNMKFLLHLLSFIRTVMFYDINFRFFPIRQKYRTFWIKGFSQFRPIVLASSPTILRIESESHGLAISGTIFWCFKNTLG